MDCIQSTSRHNQKEGVTLWLPANASKDDPLKFSAVSWIEVAFSLARYNQWDFLVQSLEVEERIDSLLIKESQNSVLLL
ncbi:hypothetical protein PTKIN_Ptkin10aG0197100 [Pterospermum kingtungense]